MELNTLSGTRVWGVAGAQERDVTHELGSYIKLAMKPVNRLHSTVCFVMALTRHPFVKMQNEHKELWAPPPGEDLNHCSPPT